MIRAAWARVSGDDQKVRKQAQPASPPRPEPVTIDAADVFDDGGRSRVPAAERAEHAARWVHKIGRPVRRADFCRAAGTDPLHGSGRGVIQAAEDCAWIARDPATGAVLPGPEKPSR
jgi:hypothetical protein